MQEVRALVRGATGDMVLVNGKGSEGTALFDLSKGLGEKTNLAQSEPDRVKKMLAALEIWKTDVARGATPQPSAE